MGGIPYDLLSKEVVPNIVLKGPQDARNIQKVVDVLTGIAKTTNYSFVSFKKVVLFDEKTLVLLNSKSSFLSGLNKVISDNLDVFNYKNTSYFDYEKFNPHLTIAKLPKFFDISMFSSIVNNIDAKLSLYNEVCVKEITLFVWDQDKEKYKEFLNFPLKQPSVFEPDFYVIDDVILDQTR
ncbi:MAG: hypothetical protein ACR2IQ_00175 [Minisyncoccia bacterium]